MTSNGIIITLTLKPKMELYSQPSIDAAGSQRIRTTAYWSSTEGYYNDALAYIMLFPGATQRLSHKWEYEVEVLAVCAF